VADIPVRRRNFSILRISIGGVSSGESLSSVVVAREILLV